MVNHARTLLINLAPRYSGLASGIEDACYVEDTFRPLEHPRVVSYRSLLNFMPDNSPETCIKAFAAIAPLLHMSSFEEWTTRHDSRITYDPQSFTTGSNTIAEYIASLSSVSSSSLVAKLQVEPAVKVYGMGSLMSSEDGITRFCATLLSYVDMYEYYRG